MQMYPGYQAEDVLEEYGVRFFALLNEGYRLRYEAALLTGHLNDLPSMDVAERRKLYQSLEWAATHPGDILKLGGTGSTPNEIKSVLG